MPTFPPCSIEPVVISPQMLLRADIYSKLDSLVMCERQLETGYAELGGLLAEFKRKECWRDLQYENFDSFMLELRDRYHRSKSQLWLYLGVAEKLLPRISAAALDEMGISKAYELKRVITADPTRELTEEVMKAAVDPKVTEKELRAILHQAYNLPADERPNGTWLDLGGFYATAEEKAEFVEFVKVATVVLELRREMPDWLQRKECILHAAREFLATYGPEVYGRNEEKSE